jgi:hypothetical protein
MDSSNKLQGVFQRMQVWAKECIAEDHTGKLEPLLQPFLKTANVSLFLIGFGSQDETQSLIEAYRDDPTNDDLHELLAMRLINQMAVKHDINMHDKLVIKSIARLKKYLKVYVFEYSQ